MVVYCLCHALTSDGCLAEQARDWVGELEGRTAPCCCWSRVADFMKRGGTLGTSTGTTVVLVPVVVSVLVVVPR
jgi:hypothetical protein